MTRDEFKARMRKKIVATRANVAQMVTDCESWNDNRLDAPPIDCGAEKVLLQLFDQLIAALDRDGMTEFDRLTELTLEQSKRATAIETDEVML